MGRITAFLSLCALALSACNLTLPVAKVLTYPLDKKATFEEAQARFTNDIRYGLYDEAAALVEPDLQARFKSHVDRFREIRFSDYTVERIDIDTARRNATAVVRYRGYWLSSPFEQEIVAVQRWRRAAPTENWYVTPDFDALLDPAGS